jgi:hypothetical protein
MADKPSLETLAPTGAVSTNKGSRDFKSFIAGVIIVGIILYALKPVWLMKTDPDGHPTDKIDWWTMLLSVLVGGFLFMLGARMMS